MSVAGFRLSFDGMPCSVRDPAFELIEQRILATTYGREQFILDLSQTRQRPSIGRSFKKFVSDTCDCFNLESVDRNQIVKRICKFCCKNCFSEILCVLIVIAIVAILVIVGKELAVILVDWIKSWLSFLDIFQMLQSFTGWFPSWS